MLSFLNIDIYSSGMKVNIVDDINEADLKVYKSEFKSDSDLSVYFVKEYNNADDVGLWYVEYCKILSNVSIFYVQDQNDADVTIYVCKDKNDAGKF